MSGLASSAGPDGSFATGVDGLAYNTRLGFYGIEAGSRDALPPGLPAAAADKLKAQAGRLLELRYRSARVVADVGHAD